MAKYFKMKTDKPALSYHCGEKIKIEVRAYDYCVETSCAYFKWELRGDDGQKSSGLGSTQPGFPYVLETSCGRPGFLHLKCTAVNRDNAADPAFDLFDGGIGVEIEKLRYSDTIPEDYEAFWQGLWKKALEFDSKVVGRRQITENVPEGFECWDLQISTPLDMPASGVLTLPKKAEKLPIEVSFRGYGLSCANPNYNPNVIRFEVNAHGFPNDLSIVESYERHKDLLNYGFNNQENERPETSYWYKMMLRDFMAMKYVKTLPAWDQKNLVVSGGSQGAFQATHMAANDPAVTFLAIHIPWFCNMNGENQHYVPGWRPQFQNGLRYFDTVAAATKVRCPVQITAYLGDYVCPPSGIVMLYQAFKNEKALDFVQGGTHGYRPPEVESYHYRFDPQNPTGAVKPGIYRHFKGNRYEVLGTVFNSETAEPQVLYRALYGDQKLWCRPQYMWHETLLKNGCVQRRFTFVSDNDRQS